MGDSRDDLIITDEDSLATRISKIRKLKNEVSAFDLLSHLEDWLLNPNDQKALEANKSLREEFYRIYYDLMIDVVDKENDFASKLFVNIKLPNIEYLKQKQPRLIELESFAESIKEKPKNELTEDETLQMNELHQLRKAFLVTPEVTFDK